MELETESPAQGARGRVWRDTVASVVFHGLELGCLLFAVGRFPDLGVMLGTLDAAPPGAPTQVIIDACNFARAEQVRLALLLMPFLALDAAVMAWLWRAPNPRAARLWFAAVAALPVAALGAVVAAALVSLCEALMR